MLKALLLSLTLTLAGMAMAQNLVPNPSFEDTSSCNAFMQGGSFEPMLGLARPWFSANDATPDVYTTNTAVACGVDVIQEGLNLPFDGLRYIGLYMFTNTQTSGGTREYPAVRLNSELVAGVTYRLSIHLARASFSRYAVSEFGAHFSEDSLHVAGGIVLPVQPQVVFSASGFFDSREWTAVSGLYTAQGGERFLYLGSFQEDPEMDFSYDPFFGGVDLGYYDIDQVELIPDDVGLVETLGKQPNVYIHGDVLYYGAESSVIITVFDARGSHMRGPFASITGLFQLPDQVSPGCYFVRVEGRDTQVLKWVKE